MTGRRCLSPHDCGRRSWARIDCVGSVSFKPIQNKTNYLSCVMRYSGRAAENRAWIWDAWEDASLILPAAERVMGHVTLELE